MKRRVRVYQTVTAECRGCHVQFTYVQLTKRKKFFSLDCASRTFNAYHNGLASAARRQARES